MGFVDEYKKSGLRVQCTGVFGNKKKIGEFAIFHKSPLKLPIYPKRRERTSDGSSLWVLYYSCSLLLNSSISSCGNLYYINRCN